MRLTTTHKVGLALLIPATGAVLALWLFYSFLIDTAADSAFINIAGRQRMLSQQLFAYTQMSHQFGHREDRQALRGLIDEFERSLTALEQGGEVLGRILPPAPREVQAAIASMRHLWLEQKPVLLKFTDPSIRAIELSREYAQVETIVSRLTEGSHNVVTAYEARNQALRARILHALIAITAFDLILLLAGIAGAKRYLAERKRSEEALRKSEKDWRLTFDSISDLVSVHDKDYRIVKANKAMADFFGLPAEALAGRRCYEVFHGTKEPVAHCPHARTLDTKQTEKQEIDDPRMGCPFLITTSPVFDEAGQVVASVHVAKDITEHRRTEQHLQHLAHYDQLTQLPNRTLFLDRLAQALTRANWHQRIVAMLFLDLDRFKVINDTLGHDTGDLLLQAVAGRLLKAVREGDTVARFGGDEFVIALVDVADEQDVYLITEKLLRELGRPFVIHDRELFVTTSIGISLYPHDGTDTSVLIRNADAAMYHAKELGKNNYQRYSPILHAGSPKRLELETSLRHALDRQEFRLHYQPKIDVITGRLRGMEALLRWQHPEIGLIAPLEFIPLLEETGLIVEVGAWVLQTACVQARAWQEAGFPDLCVAVNLSARQFTQHNLSETVVKALRASGLQPRCLELELTESILIEHSETTLAALRELSGMGIQLAIDDFGTGYSSLSYLTRFPIDTLKVDRSFVHDIATDPDDAAIVQAVIVMAHSLGLTVVAEGVETKDQLDFLRRNRCDEIQGYYFSRPLASEAFALLLEEYRRLNEVARDKESPGATPHSPADVVTKISRH